jgi:hypothetical protein
MCVFYFELNGAWTDDAEAYLFEWPIGPEMPFRLIFFSFLFSSLDLKKI